jgi:hypothetical protein
MWLLMLKLLLFEIARDRAGTGLLQSLLQLVVSKPFDDLT